jgi:hypothetical protein
MFRFSDVLSDMSTKNQQQCFYPTFKKISTISNDGSLKHSLNRFQAHLSIVCPDSCFSELVEDKWNWKEVHGGQLALTVPLPVSIPVQHWINCWKTWTDNNTQGDKDDDRWIEIELEMFDLVKAASRRVEDIGNLVGQMLHNTVKQHPLVYRRGWKVLTAVYPSIFIRYFWYRALYNWYVSLSLLSPFDSSNVRLSTRTPEKLSGADHFSLIS